MRHKSWSLMVAVLTPLSVLVGLLIWVTPTYAVDYTVGGACGATIQACIDFAAPGDTVIVPAGTYNESLTLSKPISVTGASRSTTIVRAITGQRALTVTGATIDNTVIISGLTFTEGDVSGGNVCAAGFDTTNCGGGVLVTGNAQPLFINLIISENRAYSGGGMYADIGSDLSLQNVRLVNNQSINVGGGLYVAESSLVVADSLFSQNTSRVGGGLSMSGGNVFSQTALITNTAFLSNTAICQSALGICDGGAVYAFHIDIAAVNNRFENNACRNPFDNDCDGGAIYTIGSFVDTQLALTNTDFISNAAGGFGGGVSAGSFRVSTVVNGGRFERNYAGGSQTAFSDGGGGLAVYSLVLRNAQFFNNASGEDGGAVWVRQDVEIENTQFSFNQAITNGGAVHVGFSDLILTNTDFISNTAGYNGGGAYATGQARVNGGRFERNRANGPENDGGFILTDRGGGGIWAGGSLQLTDTQFIGNIAESNGGGAHVRGSANVNGGLFDGNQSLGDFFTFSFGGGGLFVNNNLVFTDTRFTNNSAMNVGGGAFAIGLVTGTLGSFENNYSGRIGGGLGSRLDLTLVGTQFVNNTAERTGGGAVIGTGVADVPANLTDVLFQGNQVISTALGASGGGLYARDALTVTNGQFISNTSTGSGGGVSVFGSVTLNNSLFQDNEALSGSGGGLQGTFDLVTVVESNFINNIAGFAGGGLSANGRIESTDSLFQLNRTITGTGGGLSTSGLLVLTSTQLVGNSAASDGGGAFANSGAVLVDSYFEGNQSDGHGGGLSAPLGRLEMPSGDSRFFNNTAALDGGGAYAFDAILVGGSFDDNVAQENAGGLGIRRRLYLTGTQFINNSAVGLGGGVVISATSGTSTNGRLVNALFARNSAGSDGEALFLKLRSNIDLIHTTFGNPGIISGAAIHVLTGTVNITNAILSGYNTDIEVETGSIVNEDFNLFPNGLQATGGGTVSSGGNSLIGNPIFADPATDNYHLTAGSAAIDTGTDLGVSIDFEDDPRPQQSGPDIGWDEAPPFLPVLKIVKSSTDVDGGDLLPGDTLTYALVISNVGTGPASNVVISDTVPANTTYVSGSISGADSRDDSGLLGLSWLVNTLPLSTPITLAFAVTVDGEVLSGTQIVNTASITSSKISTPTFDSVTDLVREIFADVSIVKTVTPLTGLPGTPVTYTIVFSNSGDAVATGVVITDFVPVALTNVNVDNSGAAITDTGTIPGFVWQVQDLTPNQQGIITITGEISPDSTADAIANTALIATAAVDEDSGNNSSIALLFVGTIPPNLSISKTASPVIDVPYRGLITYTVTVSNTGGTDANGVLITDTLPGEVQFYQWLQQNGAIESGGQITWLGTVSANNYMTFSFVVSHTGDYGDAVTNTAEFDHAGTTGDDSAVFTVEANPDPAPSTDSVFLPVIVKEDISVEPSDLIVENLIATPNSVAVVIKNVGAGPVVDAFWVDVYINPHTAPTRVNQHWFDVSNQGIVWGVTALPIDPTESLTLTIGDAYYHGPPISNFSLPLSVGATIYAQVDSVNLLTDYGGVLEDHEISNGAYNNIFNTTVVAGTSGVNVSSVNQDVASSKNDLPPR